MIETLYNLVAGALTGAGVACGGYFKSAGDKIDWQKVGETAIIGMGVGGVGGFLGFNYDNASTYAANIGATTLFQYIAKGSMRRVYPKLKEWLVNHNFKSAVPT